MRVHLVDDHILVRDGICSLLERHPGICVVAMSSSGEAAYVDYFKHHPDVVLLDVNMPGESGLSVLKRILMRDPQARIVMLSMLNDEMVALKAIEAGAYGYLSKGIPPGELYNAVCKVAAGEMFIESDIAQRMALLRSGKGSSLQVLSSREFDVFCMLAKGRSVSKIAATLHLSPKTVGAHRTRVMVKLSCTNVAELARVAIRQGIISP